MSQDYFPPIDPETIFVPWIFEVFGWSFWLESLYEHCTKWHLFDLSTVGEFCFAVVMPVDSSDIWLTERVWLFFGLSAFKTTVPVEVVLVVEDNDDSVESVANEDSVNLWIYKILKSVPIVFKKMHRFERQSIKMLFSNDKSLNGLSVLHNS